MKDWRVEKFYGNYVIIANDDGERFFLWKDGTIHRQDTGLEALLVELNLPGDWPLGVVNYALAPGYYRTREEAISYLRGYMAIQEQQKSVNDKLRIIDNILIKIVAKLMSNIDELIAVSKQISTKTETNTGIIPAGTLMAYDDDGHLVPVIIANGTDEVQEWDDYVSEFGPKSSYTAEEVKEEFGIQLYADDEDERPMPDKCLNCYHSKDCWPDM